MKKSRFVLFLLVFILLLTILPTALAAPLPPIIPPLIIGNLKDATYLQGEAAEPLWPGLVLAGTTYQWQTWWAFPFPGWRDITGATDSSFTPPTDVVGTKEYRLETTNGADVNYTDSIKITVLTKPVLSLTPASQGITAGGQATFMATASNTDGWDLTHSYWAWGPTVNPADITGDYSANGLIATTTFSKVLNTPGTIYYFYVGEYTDIANGTKQVKVFSNGAQVNVSAPPVVNPAGNPFTDISPADWFYNDVLDAFHKGLVNGTTPTTYSPDANLTIGSAIKLAACMNQYHNSGAITLVNGTVHWYDTYVDYAVSHGIISSSAYAGRYNDNATRADYVKIFYYALPASAYPQIQNVDAGEIPDVAITAPYGPEVYTFYRAGILQGNDTIGSFSPASFIRRSEVAAIISRMITPANRITAPYSWAN